MTPIQHPSNNDVLRPPPGASIEECRPLAITRVEDAGVHGVISFWQPSDAERTAIAAGKPLYIYTLGRTHPPLHLGVEGIET